eukprot:scpid47193/ scgid29358/ 
MTMAASSRRAVQDIYTIKSKCRFQSIREKTNWYVMTSLIRIISAGVRSCCPACITGSSMFTSTCTHMYTCTHDVCTYYWATLTTYGRKQNIKLRKRMTSPSSCTCISDLRCLTGRGPGQETLLARRRNTGLPPFTGVAYSMSMYHCNGGRL